MKDGCKICLQVAQRRSNATKFTKVKFCGCPADKCMVKFWLSVVIFRQADKRLFRTLYTYIKSQEKYSTQKYIRKKSVNDGQNNYNLSAYCSFAYLFYALQCNDKKNYIYK